MNPPFRRLEEVLASSPFFRLHDERVISFRKEPNLHVNFSNRVIPHVISSQKKKIVDSWSVGHLVLRRST